MTRPRRLVTAAASAFTVAAVLLAAIAVYLSAYPSPAPDTGLEVLQPDLDLGPLSVGGHTVHIEIANRSRLPKQIIGLAEG